MQTQTIEHKTRAATGKPGGIFLWYQNLAEKYDQSRYGAMAVMMTFQSCLGSIACFYILYSTANTAMLSAGVMVTMLSNSIFIAQSPAKWAVGGFIISVAVNLALIIANFSI